MRWKLACTVSGADVCLKHLTNGGMTTIEGMLLLTGIIYGLQVLDVFVSDIG